MSNELARGHSVGETWGLAVDKSNEGVIVTSGDDNQILTYNIQTFACEQQVEITDTKVSLKNGVSTQPDAMKKFAHSQYARAICLKNEMLFVATCDGTV